MKKTLYWILLITAIGASYFIYAAFAPDFQSNTVSIKNLVPNDAVYFVSNTTFNSVLDSDNKSTSSTKKDWMVSVKPIAELKEAFGQTEGVESEIYVSCHFLDANNYELLYYGDEDLKNKLTKELEISPTVRHYKGYEIMSLEGSFSYVNLDGVFVLSKSPVLIESVCHSVENKNSLNLDEKQIYIDPKGASMLLGEDNLPKDLIPIFNVFGGVVLNLPDSDQGKIRIKGNQISGIDSVQKITRKINGNYFPMNTAFVFSGTKSYLQTEKVIQEPIAQLVGDRLTMFFVGGTNGNNLASVFISSNVQIQTNNFFKVDKGIYRDIELTSLGYYSEETDSVYITVAKMFGEYIVSENEQVIFDVIQAVDDENVWGKSIKHYDVLSTMSTNANANVIVSPSYLGYSNESNSENPSSSQMEFLVLQKTGSGDGNLVTGSISLNNLAVSSSQTISNNEEQNNVVDPNDSVVKTSDLGKNGLEVAKFDSKIISKPYLVRNHVAGGREIIVQTADYSVHLLSMSGKTLWSKKIGGEIVSGLTQVDRYKNRKLQYLFATKNEIHLLDRKGRNVEGFPIKVSHSITQFSVIDYSGKKEYRLAASDGKGNTYLYNLEGNVLGQWKPRKINGALLTSLKHFRIGSKDCLLAVTKEGKIHLFKRNGGYYDGFPMDLHEGVVSDISIQAGTSFEKSRVLVLTKFWKCICR